MATVTPALIAPAAEMADGLNLKCSAAGWGAFGRNGGHPGLWRSLLILAMLLLPAFLLTACADIRIGGFSFGSCLMNGEEFAHVNNAVFRDSDGDAFRMQVIETHTKMELQVHRAPRLSPALWGNKEVYRCVVKKPDWPEAMLAELTISTEDEITAITSRGQTVFLGQHDIDHWDLRESRWGVGLIWE